MSTCGIQVSQDSLRSTASIDSPIEKNTKLYIITPDWAHISILTQKAKTYFLRYTAMQNILYVYCVCSGFRAKFNHYMLAKIYAVHGIDGDQRPYGNFMSTKGRKSLE